MGISECHLSMAAIDPFRPCKVQHTLCRIQEGAGPRQRRAVVPGHPIRRCLLQLLRSFRSTSFDLPDPEGHYLGGRFNHYGKPVVYLAETAESAATEVLEEGESRAWVMRFQLRDVGPILDLSISEAWAEEELPVLAIGLGYFGNLSRLVKRDKGWKPEYLLPRFIADCARLNGFVGVVFRSSRYWADNLVLFAWDDQKIVADAEPRIIEVRPWKHPRGYRDPLGFWIPEEDAEPIGTTQAAGPAGGGSIGRLLVPPP